MDTHKLRITVSNMKNANTVAQLETMRDTVLQNLSQLPPAPSVPFTRPPPKFQVVRSLQPMHYRVLPPQLLAGPRTGAQCCRICFQLPHVPTLCHRSILNSNGALCKHFEGCAVHPLLTVACLRFVSVCMVGMVKPFTTRCLQSTQAFSCGVVATNSRMLCAAGCARGGSGCARRWPGGQGRARGQGCRLRL